VIGRFDPLTLGAALASATAVGALVRLIVPPPRRLRGRVSPHVSPRPGVVAVGSGSVIDAVFGPPLRAAADWIGGLLERDGVGVTAIRLRQADWYSGLDEHERLARYRMRQLAVLVVALVGGLGVSRIIGASLPMTSAFLVLAGVVGATRTKGRLEAAIVERRGRMNIEIYTVNQLLAMRVRVGGGVVNAVAAVVERGSGEVVAELAEALRLHRAGWSGADAFRRIAELTPEPFCARTYRVLATAEERGADLAGALLALSEDVREARRETLRRTAAKRRAGMLVPTIAILAPVMLLFVAAPLPYLITRWQ
jgi:tight adherence protein C